MADEPRRPRDPNPTFTQGLVFGMGGILILANMVLGGERATMDKLSEVANAVRSLGGAVAGGMCIIASAICWRN